MSQRRLPRTASVRSGACSARPARTLRSVLVAVVAGTALVVTAAPALAAPPPPPNPTDSDVGAAMSQQDVAAAEVGRIAGLVAAAEADLERLGVHAEAAGTAYEIADQALREAQGRAEEAAALLQQAAEAVAAAQLRIAHFSRDSYMSGGAMTASAVLLSAEGPGDLLQRVAMLDYVAIDKVDVLSGMEIARIAQANAESVARAARDETAAAEQTAQAAKAAADAQVAVQRGAYVEIEAQKDVHEQQLEAANIQLLQLQGARNAYQQWQQQKAAEEAAQRVAAERAAAEVAAAAAAARRQSAGSSSGGVSTVGSGSGSSSGGIYVKPTSGRVSSCFGWRWGALHGGVDIAAPIGTPVYSVHSGVVQRVGGASGFGYAVYILGDDGYVTVYGHINDYFVRAGERVRAGEVIAEVGNRGESTGPHLHFEAHPRGVMYGGQVDPVGWLRARGVNLGGC